MTKYLRYMAVAALATVGMACSEGPTDVNEEFEGELVITEGVAAPEYVARERPRLAAAAAGVSASGSLTTPLTLLSNACGAGASQQITVTYTITGQQNSTNTSFQVNSNWSYNGSAWSGSVPVAIPVAPRSGSDNPTVVQRTFTVTNASTTSTGQLSFSVPVISQTASSPTLQLNNAVALVYVVFAGCEPPNTAPTLVLPNDMTIEAVSASGAPVSFVVTATDNEDGDLTSTVTCSPASGSTFPLGITTVNCSVTDTEGETTTGSFKITVEDTTPAIFTSFPTSTVNLIAANIYGAVLDVAALGITVEDVGNVSEPSTYSCDYVAGTALAIGSTTDVDCIAKDAIGNVSAIHTFQVFVGLNVNASGFLPPLRMMAPFSAHKRGSTIPHKFLPPTYADGTPATDLASGLGLTLRRIDGIVEADVIDGTEYATGSTDWRYDAESGHYIFNLKTGTTFPWDPGTWTTTASYAGITLATTKFDLKR